MNLIKKASAAVAVASMVAMPVAASAAPVAAERVDASVDANSELRGGGVILGLIAAALIIAGIIIAVDAQDNNPVSA